MMSPPLATLQQVWLTRRRVPVLRDVTLKVAAGEHVTLLANDPAASEAVLMLLAGLARPNSGTVRLAGRDVAAVPPERRGVAVVHRGLGLFERMTVAENAAFAGASPRAVRAMLLLAGLQARAAARPAALSGPERVRLAIARALLQRSPLLLLNQMLAGLDAEAREAAGALIATARAEREFAIVHAAADADAAFIGFGVGQQRLVVLAGGAVEQEGTPRMVYDAPATVGVAAMTGAVNMLHGTVLDTADGEVLVGLAPGIAVAAQSAAQFHEQDFGIGLACVVCVRPERIALAAADLASAESDAGAFTATVRDVAFRRDHWRVRLQLDAGPDTTGERLQLLVERPAGVPMAVLRTGAMVAVAWQAHHATAYRTDAAGADTAGMALVAPPIAHGYPAGAPPTLQDRPR